jgi:putative iron-dependent peroxidase
LDYFETLPQSERDNIIGRRLSDNEELDDAPLSAHVKRTAQESFEPEAFILRRSMPWAGDGGEGLMFVAFGRTLDAFEVQLRRMTGQDDGIVDGLFRFSRAISGSYFWCPPLVDGRLDLSAIGI